jgi:DNA-binding CsgD family transcriptional regulator
MSGDALVERSRDLDMSSEDRSPSPTGRAWPEVGLTTQELKALSLYGSGLTSYSAARRMGVGEETLKTYIKRIRRKYAAAGVPLESKIDLYRLTCDLGLLPGPPTG